VNKRTKVLMAIGVIAALVVGWQVIAFANHVHEHFLVQLPDSNFEIDGAEPASVTIPNPDTTPGAPATITVPNPGANLKVDHDGTVPADDPDTPEEETLFPELDDWESVDEIRVADTASGQRDESFGNGTKEDTAVPSVVDGGIPPSKSDLKFFGVYQEGDTATGFLNLYWSRVQEPTGTTNMDFEFNKNKCEHVDDDNNPATPAWIDADNDPKTFDTAEDGSTCSANHVTPVRSQGDSLIQYDLSQGGRNPTLWLSTWVTTGNKSQCEASNTLPCWSTKENLTASGEATGSINNVPIPADEADGLGAHSARTFGEAQVKLSALIPEGSCVGIGAAYLKGRSSDSFTSALKDFVPPESVDITNCGKVIIRKVTDPATDTTASFGYTMAGGFATTPTSSNTFSLKNGENKTYTGVVLTPANSTGYTVNETTIPSSWEFVSVNCGASTGVPNSSAGYQINGSTVTFKIDSASDILDCTYTNRQVTTTLGTEQSFIPQDKAIVGGSPNSGFNGTVDFRLYTGPTCSGTLLAEMLDRPLSGTTANSFATTNNDGDDTDAQGTPVDTIDGHTITEPGGTFSWKVKYEGDTVDPNATPADTVAHPVQETCIEESTLTIDNDNRPATP
jgi:hypothetical protein